MQTVTLEVNGMTCGHCKQAVGSALTNLAGVQNVDVDLKTGKVKVQFDSNKVGLGQMKEAVEDQGYDVVA